MKSGLFYLAFFAFGMMILQSILSYLQYKNYQKAVNLLRGYGHVLGIGMRKGGFNLKGGSIVILAWDEKENKVM
ncbi:MAG: transcriptional regulator GutM, partial [Eubacterium sp.]